MDAWDFQPEVALSLLPFHALKGSDSTSFLAGHSKRTAFMMFMEHFQLLSNLGRTNEAGTVLFKRGLKAELLPPTSDVTKNHLKRVHHQSMI